VLFRSSDAGATWHRIGTGTGGFAGGDILLPPSYPLDPLVFAVGPAGLQRSSDGGATFTALLPKVSRAAIDPGAKPGNGRILLATAPLLVYGQASGLVSSGPTLPAGIVGVSDVQFISDQLVVVAGQRVDPLAPGQSDAVVMVCTWSSCPGGTAFPGKQPGRLFVSPTAEADHTLGVALGSAIELSHDYGKSFSALSSPGLAAVLALGFDPAFATSHSLLLAGRSASPPGRPVILSTVDGGSSLSPVGDGGLPNGSIGAVVMLPDDHWLVGMQTPDLLGDWGMRCSGDHGQHWTPSC